MPARISPAGWKMSKPAPSDATHRNQGARPWELAKRVAPHMRRQGGGRFIVIIGQTGKVPQANAIASTITNAAQHAFVKSLSDDLARDNILVNAVCPSRIKSPLTDGLDALQRGVSRSQPRAAGSALGRRGAARTLGHARRHRECRGFPGLGARRFHRRRQYRCRWRPPTLDILTVARRHDRHQARLESFQAWLFRRRGVARLQSDHRRARSRSRHRTERLRQIHAC